MTGHVSRVLVAGCLCDLTRLHSADDRTVKTWEPHSSRLGGHCAVAHSADLAVSQNTLNLSLIQMSRMIHKGRPTRTDRPNVKRCARHMDLPDNFPFGSRNDDCNDDCAAPLS